MSKNKEKEFMKGVFEALKSDSYLPVFKLDYLDSLNNVLLNNDKINLSIEVLSNIIDARDNKKIKPNDYYKTILSSVFLVDKYYDDLKDRDLDLITTLSYTGYYLVGVDMDSFMYLFGDGILINKLSDKKKDGIYLLENMSKALNSFNKRKDIEEMSIIKDDLINHSDSICNLESLFKMNGDIKNVALEISKKRSK